MPAPVHLDRGQGPTVVLLHGVGLGPESFTSMVELLEDDHRVVVIERPGGGGRPAVPLADQVDQIAATIRSVDADDAAGATVVGVSGGATLGLLLAVRHPQVAGGVVLHEPLVGHHARLLHHRFRTAATRAAISEAEAMEVVRSVMGEQSWAELGPDGQAASWADAARWQAEIGLFAAFDPSVADLLALAATPALVTTGEHSLPERRDAAEVLRRLGGAEVAVVPGAGNAAHLDAPAALVALIRSWSPLPVGERP